MEQDVLISVSNLSKLFGKGKLTNRVLDLQRFEVRKGAFTALTGPSGCGKTTLLNLLGGLDRPSGGEILFAGRSIVNRGESSLCNFRRNNIGFVFQAFNLITSLTALKNVLVPALPEGGATRRQAMEVLRMVGLEGKEHRRPGSLSGGEQQRVAIARALILDPELILADEPTGNLDSESGARIIELLRRLNEKGKTIIVATHDQRVAEACSKIIRMVDGRIVDSP